MFEAKVLSKCKRRYRPATSREDVESSAKGSKKAASGNNVVVVVVVLELERGSSAET